MLRGKMPFSSHLGQSTRGRHGRWRGPQSPGRGGVCRVRLWKGIVPHEGDTTHSAQKAGSHAPHLWGDGRRNHPHSFCMGTCLYTWSLIHVSTASSTLTLWVRIQHCFTAQTVLALVRGCCLWPLTNLHHFCFVRTFLLSGATGHPGLLHALPVPALGSANPTEPGGGRDQDRGSDWQLLFKTPYSTSDSVTLFLWRELSHLNRNINHIISKPKPNIPLPLDCVPIKGLCALRH